MLQARLDDAESVGTANAADITDLQASVTDIKTDLTNAATCAAQGKDYNPATDTCTTRPNLGVFPLNYESCATANTVFRQGSALVFCDDSKVAQMYFPAVRGSRPEAPAASCAALRDAGEPDGWYYIGANPAAAIRTYCVEGVQVSHWIDWDLIGGPPVSYFSFDDTLADHISDNDLTLVSGSTQFADGRIGRAGKFDTNSYYKTKIDNVVFASAFTVV